MRSLFVAAENSDTSMTTQEMGLHDFEDGFWKKTKPGGFFGKISGGTNLTCVLGMNFGSALHQQQTTSRWFAVTPSGGMFRIQQAAECISGGVNDLIFTLQGTITYPTWRKGKSSTQTCPKKGVSFRECTNKSQCFKRNVSSLKSLKNWLFHLDFIELLCCTALGFSRIIKKEATGENYDKVTTCLFERRQILCVGKMSSSGALKPPSQTLNFQLKWGVSLKSGVLSCWPCQQVNFNWIRFPFFSFTRGNRKEEWFGCPDPTLGYIQMSTCPKDRICPPPPIFPSQWPSFTVPTSCCQ